MSYIGNKPTDRALTSGDIVDGAIATVDIADAAITLPKLDPTITLGAVNGIFYENSQVVTTNYTITSGKNAMSAGPITINNGVVVTIPTGSVWTIV